MKKIFLLVLISFLILSKNAYSVNEIEKFKDEFSKLNLDQKAVFCYPILEYGLLSLLLNLKIKTSLEEFTLEEKEQYEEKIKSTFSNVFMFQRYLTIYWLDSLSSNISEDINVDNLFKIFESEKYRELLEKKKIELALSKKSEEYLKSISFIEFNKERLLGNCLKDLTPLFESRKFKEILKSKENTEIISKSIGDIHAKYRRIKNSVEKSNLDQLLLQNKN